jgi:hypothetical protein
MLSNYKLNPTHVADDIEFDLPGSDLTSDLVDSIAALLVEL